MDKAKKSFAMNILRRGSYKHYGRWQANKRSHLGHNQYYCENPICGVIGPKKDFQLDHIVPVQAVTGFDGFDNIIDRLYCDAEGFQRLCLQCHSAKTKCENELRPKNVKKKSLTKRK